MPEAREHERLFVYGTLRPGSSHPLAALLARDARTLGAATIRARLYDLGAYPGAVLNDTDAALVHGELLELRTGSAILGALDSYEGCSPPNRPPALFARERTQVRLADGATLDAWVYVFARDCDESALVASGRWSVHGA